MDKNRHDPYPKFMQVEEVVWARRLARSGGARVIREGAGLSASEVARLIGVTPGAVSRWNADCESRDMERRNAGRSCYGG